jgi:hypothetical protein
MDESDSDMIAKLERLRFAAPPLERVWTGGRDSHATRARRPVALALALCAILSVSGVALGMGSGALDNLRPKGACASDDLRCGSNYLVAGIIVDVPHDTRLVVVAAAPGLSTTEYVSIAHRAAQDVSGPDGQVETHRTIVYVYSGLASTDQAGEFPAVPVADDQPALAPPPSLMSFWMVTLDRGPWGEHVTQP